MKKLSPLLVVVLALLMQLRVAHACEVRYGGPQGCDSHGLVVDAHPDQPSDRGERCDPGLDLAVRGGRNCTDLSGLLLDLHGDDVAVLPARPADPISAATAATGVPADRVRPAHGPGSRVWLETARLRL